MRRPPAYSTASRTRSRRERAARISQPTSTSEMMRLAKLSMAAVELHLEGDAGVKRGVAERVPVSEQRAQPQSKMRRAPIGKRVVHLRRQGRYFLVLRDGTGNRASAGTALKLTGLYLRASFVSRRPDSIKRTRRVACGWQRRFRFLLQLGDGGIDLRQFLVGEFCLGLHGRAVGRTSKLGNWNIEALDRRPCIRTFAVAGRTDNCNGND